MTRNFTDYWLNPINRLEYYVLYVSSTTIIKCAHNTQYMENYCLLVPVN